MRRDGILDPVRVLLPQNASARFTVKMSLSKPALGAELGHVLHLEAHVAAEELAAAVGHDRTCARDPRLQAVARQAPRGSLRAAAAVVVELLVEVARQAEAPARTDALHHRAFELKRRGGLVVGRAVLGAGKEACGARGLEPGRGIEPGGGDEGLEAPDVLAVRQRVDGARREVHASPCRMSPVGT